jgi:hypothetical protein
MPDEPLLLVGAEQIRLYVNKLIRPAKLSVSAIYRLIESGQLPAGRLGRKLIAEPQAVRSALVKIATTNCAGEP